MQQERVVAVGLGGHGRAVPCFATHPPHPSPCHAQAAANERSAVLQKAQLAAEHRAAALEAAQAEVLQQLAAAQARLAELEGAAAVAAAPANAAQCEAPASPSGGSKACDGAALKVTPLLGPSGRSARAAPAGVPLLLSTGKWVLAAGAVAVLGLAASALGGGGSRTSCRRVDGNAGKAAPAAVAVEPPAPASEALASNSA